MRAPRPIRPTPHTDMVTEHGGHSPARALKRWNEKSLSLQEPAASSAGGSSSASPRRGDWEVIALARKPSDSVNHTRFLSVDLLDPRDCSDKLSARLATSPMSSMRRTRSNHRERPGGRQRRNAPQPGPGRRGRRTRAWCISTRCRGPKPTAASLDLSRRPPRRPIRGIFRRISTMTRKTFCASGSRARPGRGRRYGPTS